MRHKNTHVSPGEDALVGIALHKAAANYIIADAA
jgi:hypothetical protein